MSPEIPHDFDCVCAARSDSSGWPRPWAATGSGGGGSRTPDIAPGLKLKDRSLHDRRRSESLVSSGHRRRESATTPSTSWSKSPPARTRSGRCVSRTAPSCPRVHGQERAARRALPLLSGQLRHGAAYPARRRRAEATAAAVDVMVLGARRPAWQRRDRPSPIGIVIRLLDRAEQDDKVLAVMDGHGLRDAATDVDAPRTVHFPGVSRHPEDLVRQLRRRVDQLSRPRPAGLGAAPDRDHFQ